jgi:hypothetical protein
MHPPYPMLSFWPTRIIIQIQCIREIFHILLTMPIESIPCERPFSALRRLKQRNRTTMVEDRLNGLALLHIYREVNVGRIKILDKFDTGNRGIAVLRL